MLTELHIQNIAVIHKAGFSLEAGLNVFTGETGAGKTILISAIDVVLGERAPKEMIRAGEDKAVVTALFEDISPGVRSLLAELGYPDEDGALLVSREISASGKGGCKLNGAPATAAILKKAASMLIHIHGQRDGLQLLEEQRHLGLIDAFGETGEELAAYRRQYDALRALREELGSLQMDDAQKAQRMDMLGFQIKEIEAADLKDTQEEEALLAQRGLIRNSEKVQSSLSRAYGALQGDEDGESDGILALLDGLIAGAGEAGDYIPSLEPMTRRAKEMGYELGEFALELRGILEDFSFDARELDVVEARLDLIYKLKRKYGEDIQAILCFLEKSRRELDSISTSERRIAELIVLLEKQERAAREVAETLSARRMDAAADFVRGVEAELAFLDMPSVKLSVRREERSLSVAGIDEMEFYIVTNVGEEPKPLSKIASGGELSRIMLAVKNVLAEKDGIDTLVFDEVDAGVSGRAARKIGKKLSEVARSRQVLCVTHLAQVAAFGDNHLLIHKEVEGERTFTRITTLDHDQRVRELARIGSGDLITETALKNAQELLASAHDDR